MDAYGARTFCGVGHRMKRNRVSGWKGGAHMRVIAIALIVVGIVGLILTAVLPVIGIPGIAGALAALLSGIGFLYLCRCAHM